MNALSAFHFNKINASTLYCEKQAEISTAWDFKLRLQSDNAPCFSFDLWDLPCIYDVV